MQHLLDKLDAIAELEIGWNGKQSPPPTPRAINAARAWVRELMRLYPDGAPYRIEVGPYGQGVTFEFAIKFINSPVPYTIWYSLDILYDGLVLSTTDHEHWDEPHMASFGYNREGLTHITKVLFDNAQRQGAIDG